MTQSRRSIIAIATPPLLFVSFIRNNNEAWPPAQVPLWWWRKIRQRCHFAVSDVRILQQASLTGRSGSIKTEKANSKTSQQIGKKNASSITFNCINKTVLCPPTIPKKKKNQLDYILKNEKKLLGRQLIVTAVFFPIKMSISIELFFIFCFYSHCEPLFSSESSFWLNWNWIIICLFRKDIQAEAWAARWAEAAKLA